MLAIGAALEPDDRAVGLVGLDDEAGRGARRAPTPRPTPGDASSSSAKSDQVAEPRRPHRQRLAGFPSGDSARGRRASRRIDARAASSPSMVIECATAGSRSDQAGVAGRAPVERPHLHRQVVAPELHRERCRASRDRPSDEDVVTRRPAPRNLQQRRDARRAVAAQAGAEHQPPRQRRPAPAGAVGVSAIPSGRRAGCQRSRNASCDVGGVTAGRSRPAQTTGRATIAASGAASDAGHRRGQRRAADAAPAASSAPATIAPATSQIAGRRRRSRRRRDARWAAPSVRSTVGLSQSSSSAWPSRPL